MQRSSHRVEEIKAKRALTKTQPGMKTPSDAREKPKAKAIQPISCQTKTNKTEAQQKTGGGGGHAEKRQVSDKSDSIKLKKSQPPPSGMIQPLHLSHAAL